MDAKEETRLKARFDTMIDQIRESVRQAAKAAQSVVEQGFAPLDPSKGEEFDPENAKLALEVDAFLRSATWQQKGAFYYECATIHAQHQGLLDGPDAFMTMLGMVGNICIMFKNGPELVREFIAVAKALTHDKSEGDPE
jgi:hypothetical protein